MVLDTATVSVHSVTAGRAARAVCTPTCDLTGILTEKNVARGRICTIHGQEAATGDLVGHIPLHIGITAAAKVEAHVQFGCVALQHNIAAGKGVVDIIDGDSRSAAKVNAVIFDRGADMDPAAGNGVVQITVDGHRIAGCMEAFTVHIAACHNEIYIAGQGQVDKWLKDPQLSADGKKLDTIPGQDVKEYAAKVMRYHESYKEAYPDVLVCTVPDDTADGVQK